MSENKPVKGYKVFNPDWTCKGFQYKVGESYEMDEAPIACERGFHFCKKLKDCFDYYGFNKENKVAEVTAYGEVVREDKIDNRCCTNKIKIEREITWDKVTDIVNIGKDNRGLKNIGNCNVGNNNIGESNIGNFNAGGCNIGKNNTGSCNIGKNNRGYFNVGDSNIGSYNTGNNNIGHYNAGDYNISSYNNGCFNTIETKIFLFNKLSEWTNKQWLKSDARIILMCHVKVYPTEWIQKSHMTKKEKKQHPEYEITGGYLKKLTQQEIFQKQQENWNQLSQVKKDIVMSIPNFDKDIFKQITGIDVDMEG